MKGLTDIEVTERLRQFGHNELPANQPKNIWQIAYEAVKEPMFILLLICSSLYIILGDYNEGLILAFWVVAIIFMTFWQNRKTERSLEALRQLSSPRALVIRNGEEVRIPGRDIVPDDIVLLQEGDRIAADAILIEQSYLKTDESILTGESMPVDKSTNTESENKVYSGTLVVQGHAKARVTATGTRTQFGKIGESLKSIEIGSTHLQAEMKVLIRNLFIIGIAFSAMTILVHYLTRGHFIEALLNGLAASMSLIPEEFPVVLTVFLALGAWRLSKKNILTRRQSAIETLGSATVLCSDKTGTITLNKMRLSKIWLKERLIDFDNATHEPGIIRKSVEQLLHASSENTHDPMERAIQEADDKHSLNTNKQNALMEYPLSHDLFAMTRVLLRDNTKTAYCKGAPEAVYELCKLSDEEKLIQKKRVKELAEKGYRVLAFASGIINDELPDNQKDLLLDFDGLVAFEDPVREEVPQAIQECYSAGIKVIMITGDYPETALSIGSKIGLEHNNRYISGYELKDLSEEDLKIRIKDTVVFARIVPEQKLQIIKALQSNGEIVAMTGDGVNDAPALKAADIGVAMGLKGTDVAREASAMVLLDDNFASIVKAVRQGRLIYDNLQKALSYIMAIHIPIIGLVIIPAFFSALPILLMPLHIVFLEMIIDPVCSLAFESEQEEIGIMNHPPRHPNEQFFGWNKIISSALKGLLLLAMVLSVYFLSINEGHSEGQIRAIAFSSLILGNMFLIISSLSATRSFLNIIKEKNTWVLTIFSIALSLLFISIYNPWMQTLFNFENPGLAHFVPAIGGSLILMLVLESLKLFRIKKFPLAD